MAASKPRGLARGLTNYGDAGFSLYLRRSFAQSMGYSGEMLARPIVGIADSRSGFNNCHRHFPELIEAAKRGVLAAGGLPVLVVIQLLLSAATAVLVGVIARELRPGPLVAPAAGLLAAVYPWTFAYVGGEIGRAHV